MIDDHDEQNCPHLHELMKYTIIHYSLNKGSKQFKFWYENIFKNENPMSDCFEFSVTEEEGEDLLEVLQFNPFFSVDALEAMFSGYQMEKEQNKKKSIELVRDN